MLPAREVVSYAREVRETLSDRRGRPAILDQHGRPIAYPERRRRERLAYEGAKRGRRAGGWVTASTSANAEIAVGLSALRDRSRDLIRNNPHAAKAQRVFRSHVVGTGINPKSKNKELIQLWYEQGEVIDADGHSDVQGIISLAVGAIFESGEVLIRKRPRRTEDGLPLPFQVQVLEPDHLDTGKNELLRGGGRIVMGIELDPIGRRVAYWLFPEHPGEGAFGRVSFQSVRVPAENVIHSFERWRPGQVRGVPWLTPSMLPMRQVDDWVDADLMRKTIEACIVGWVKRPEGIEGSPFGERTVKADDEPDHEMFEPGTWHYGRPGETVEFNDPKGNTDIKFMDERLHAIAAGAGIPYEEMTGNLSQVNFASFRGGRLSFWATVKEFRALTVIPQVCRRLWGWHIDEARLVGKLPQGDTFAAWGGPKFPTVNPQQDAMGDLLQLRMGGLSWAQYITEQNLDPDEQLAEIAEWNERFDEAEIVLEGDPRKVTRSGMVQSGPPPDVAGE